MLLDFCFWKENYKFFEKVKFYFIGYSFNRGLMSLIKILSKIYILGKVGVVGERIRYFFSIFYYVKYLLFLGFKDFGSNLYILCFYKYFILFIGFIG